ncbi:hypothetical protein [Streptomyces pseudovenezuelae]|uniref:Uncharacterized protein n=1 Tax=Streptomyces pseudovenezuelae TaxID=67350 RepID=A0ABT6M4F1_9ACTN|nr:hypothetical protein [Streptomyces pseudovenezuelae]MDH6222866.1 hypothetical protein [Streptomyces pseudovenezuelae]
MDPQDLVESLREGGLRGILLADSSTERDIVLAAMLIEAGAAAATSAERELLTGRLAQIGAARSYAIRAVSPT